ncbi:MAG TPA: glycosyltransferase family 2 protein [Ilumatobacter sp.]
MSERSEPSAVTAVVVAWRSAAFIDACLDAVAAAAPGRILVVDNASTDGTAARLAARNEVDVLRLDRNRGFAGGIAAALERVTTPFLALVNDDAEPQPGWLDALLAPFAAPDGDSVGATTAKLVLPDGRINNAGGALLPDLYGFDRGLGDPDDGRWDTADDVEAFCGAGAVLRTAAVREVGGFPAHFFLYYEDTDTSLRLRRAGWRIRYVPAARITHRHSASSDQRSARFHYFNERNRLLMIVRGAPAGVARRELWRFTRSVAGFARLRLRGHRPAQPSEGAGLRLRVLAAVAVRLPRELIARWRGRRRRGSPPPCAPT